MDGSWMDSIPAWKIVSGQRLVCRTMRWGSRPSAAWRTPHRRRRRTRAAGRTRTHWRHTWRRWKLLRIREGERRVDYQSNRLDITPSPNCVATTLNPAVTSWRQMQWMSLGFSVFHWLKRWTIFYNHLTFQFKAKEFVTRLDKNPDWRMPRTTHSYHFLRKKFVAK